MKAVLAKAVDWYVQLNDSSADDTLRRQWRAWLAADPRHAEAWQRLEQLQGQLRLAPAGIGQPMEAGRANRRQALKLLVLLVGSSVVGLQGYRRSALSADYATGTGQRKQVTLVDGTRLELNTDTQVVLHYDANQRLLELRHGEIYLHTAADPRPLSVQTRHGLVRALGTRFTVRLDPQQTRVSVQAHAVQARPALAPAQGVRLEAGQAVAFDAEHAGPLQQADEAADSWREGMLVVVDWRLDALLAELSRYRPGYLGCAPQVAGLRVSGAYTVDDIDAVLDNLSLSLPVQLRRFSRYWVRLEPGAA